MREKNTIRAAEYTFSDCAMRMIRSLVALELLFYGFCTIMSSSFENWVITGKAYVYVQLLLISVVVINELIPLLGTRAMIRVRIVMEILVLGGMGVIAWREGEQLWTGYRTWFDDYLPYWNRYMKTNYLPYETGGSMAYAFTFTVTLLVLCMVILRYVTERRIYLVLPNLAAFVAVILVDVRPDAGSLLSSLAGVLVLYSGGWDVGKASVRTRIGRQHRTGQRMLLQLMSIAAVLLFVGLITVVTVVCFRKPASHIPDHAQEILAAQKKIEQQIRYLGTDIADSATNQDKASLDNSTPRYSDEVVMTIRSKRLPQTNLYLKSFCSSTYRNGTWQTLDHSFESEAQQLGIDTEKLATLLQQNLYEKAKLTSGSIARSYSTSECEMVIDYADAKGQKAMLPYISDMSDSADHLWADGDAFVRKDDSSSITFYQVLTPWTAMIGYSYVYSNVEDDEKASALKWYDKYVMNHYRVGTSDIPMIQTYKNEITQRMENSNQLSYEVEGTVYERARKHAIESMKATGDYTRGDAEEGMSSESICYINNTTRREIAYEVQSRLAEDATYNLYLDSLPFGTDPIEYFLKTGKEGYCMHFASAGALLLQEMGVPARYASGYVVKRGAFEQNDSVVDGAYTVQVKDRSAHAWVEIYMDGLGWVPYEMTPGYGSTGDYMPTDAKHEEQLKRDHENKGKEPETQKPTENDTQQDTQKDTQQDTQQDTQKDTQKSSPIDPSKESTENIRHNSTGVNRQILRVVLCVVGVILLLLAIACAIGKAAADYRKRLVQQLQNKHNRKAVRTMNRRIYRGLTKGHPMNTVNVSHNGGAGIHLRPLTDEEYAQKLAKAYPAISPEDWARYMEIVKKSAYSKEPISDEEAGFCLKIYQSRRKNRK